MLKWLAVAATLSLTLAGCDPCAGVGSCKSGVASVNVDGQIVQAETGKGVDGVEVSMIRIGGNGTIAVDSLATKTSNGGFWRLSVPSFAPESVLVRFRVAGPGLAEPFSVYRWIVPTFLKGDAFLVGRWVTTPYYPYFVQLHQRGRPAQTFGNVAMDFHQTGGPPVRGADENGDLHFVTNPDGYVQFFFYNAFASDTGLIEGQIIAHLPGAYGSSKAVVDLYPTITYHVTAYIMHVNIGPSLNYFVSVVGADNRPVPGVRINFTRKSGIATDPSSFSVTTDAAGRATFPLVALGAGKVAGTVVLTPPAGASQSLNVTIPTFDTDSTRLFATWRLGAGQPLADQQPDRRP